MKQIPLYRKSGIVAYGQIDDDDYFKVNQYRWMLGNRDYICMAAKKKLLLHRFIMNASKNILVDHIDHNPLNNQKSNLRLCNLNQNGQNRLKQKKKTSSKYKGVCWNKNKNKWQTYIQKNNKPIYLGLFENEIDAARKYNSAAIKYFGEFALLNEIPKETIIENFMEKEECI